MTTSFLFILAIVVIASANVCQSPQKYTFLSYKALSQRDTLPAMFRQLSSHLSPYQYSYTANHTYNLTNIKTSLMYLESQQTETYDSDQTVKVQLGSLKWMLSFMYSIDSNGSILKGTGIADLVMDPGSFFIKELLSTEGALEWNPTQIKQLTASSLFELIQSTPKVPMDDKLELQKILSDHTNSTKKLKEQLLTDINKIYKEVLKEHLNRQKLFPDTNYTYEYNTSSNRSIKIDIQANHKNYSISQNASHGIQIPFFFGVKGDTTDCGQREFQLNTKQFGGVQQVFSREVLIGIFKAALKQGLCDVTVDEKWEVSTWQFYMGDLANIIDQAYQYPPTDTFKVQCKWDQNEENIKLAGISDHEYFIQAGVICKVVYKQSEKVSMAIPIAFQVVLIAQTDHLTLKITRAYKNRVTFTIIDEKFKITNEAMADWAIKQVLDGMVGSEVFGTNWEIIPRKFPSTIILTDYLIIFDPSEK